MVRGFSPMDARLKVVPMLVGLPRVAYSPGPGPSVPPWGPPRREPSE